MHCGYEVNKKAGKWCKTNGLKLQNYLTSSVCSLKVVIFFKHFRWQWILLRRTPVVFFYCGQLVAFEYLRFEENEANFLCACTLFCGS